MSLITKQEKQDIFLHQNIRFLRKQLKLSQEELGGRIGLNRGNIASYENGSAEPKICNLLKLSNLFGVSIIDLTQKDLSEGQNLQASAQNFQELSSNELELMEQFEARAAELQQVIQSIHTCFEYKARANAAEVKGDKPYQMACMKFEELFDASSELLEHHRSLIDFVACKFKKPSAPES